MLLLVLAACYFVGLHLCIAGTGLRGNLIARLGQGLYRGLFALASLVGLIALIAAYAHAPYVELWGQVYRWRGLAGALVLLALAFIVLGMSTRRSAAITGGSMPDDDEIARGIFRVTRHPVLVGVALWAVVHIAYNGDLASLVFFTSFLILVLFGAQSLDRKLRLAHAEQWQRYGAKTSVVPFVAIAQGRNCFRFGEFGWWRLLSVAVVYAVLLHAHRWLFGVSPFAP